MTDEDVGSGSWFDPFFISNRRSLSRGRDQDRKEQCDTCRSMGHREWLNHLDISLRIRARARSEANRRRAKPQFRRSTRRDLVLPSLQLPLLRRAKPQFRRSTRRDLVLPSLQLPLLCGPPSGTVAEIQSAPKAAGASPSSRPRKELQRAPRTER